MSDPKDVKTVMISYQWDSHPLVFRVRDHLEYNGVNVIIGAGGIKGGFLEWKVKAADAIILLLTPKYEQSKDCQKEAKFAKCLGKKIIPLVGERAYTGGKEWLAILIVGLMYYDILDDFETSMDNILRREMNVVPKKAKKVKRFKFGELGLVNTKPLTSYTPWSLSNTLDGHTDAVLSVSFHPEGAMLASASADKTIKLWDVRTGKELQTLNGHSHSVNSVIFHPEGWMLASADGEVRLLDVGTGKELQTFSHEYSHFSSVSFHPGGAILAFCSGPSYFYSRKNEVELCDIRTGKGVQSLTGHSREIKSISFHPEGDMLASGSGDNTVKLWDIRTGKEIQTFLVGRFGNVYSVSFHPQGAMLASGSRNRTLKLWGPN